MKHIYLDYAATTPIDPKVTRVMMRYTAKQFGNPSSLHFFGQEAMGAVDKARARIAEIINANFREVLFTGSATEANNLALWGVLLGARNFVKGLPKVIISSIEHESVLKTALSMEKAGEMELALVPVNRNGIVDLHILEKELNERTVLVSVMYVNNEIGSIEPIKKISEVIKNFREKSKIKNIHSPIFPLFHTDAVQAFQYLPCDVSALGVDLMTLSAHKLYGPKGVGALYVRDALQIIDKKGQKTNILQPIITGGGQEFDMRSGTENVAGIAGFAEALALADIRRNEEYKRILKLKSFLWDGIQKLFPNITINGSDENNFDNLVPHILNVAFREFPVDELFTRFDMMGIAVSTGSACTSRAPTNSHVLSALFLDAPRGIRFSFGRMTTKGEINEVLKRMEQIAASSSWSIPIA